MQQAQQALVCEERVGHEMTISTPKGKDGLSDWTRAHADAPITWWTEAGPGGTIIIHETGREDVVA